ncbi:MAG: hypothetical protein HYS74_01065 [Parcubacteria group bacterium]|nr:hypothetical protein [Parcubacteria group bacterium]
MRSKVSVICWSIFAITVIGAGILISDACNSDPTGCGYVFGLGPIVFLMYGGLLYLLIPLVGIIFDAYKWRMLKDKGVGIWGRTVGTSVSFVISVWAFPLLLLLIGF